MKKSSQQINKRVKNDSPVYSATFTFRIKNYDSEFEHFNEMIDDIADSNPGYLGKKRWSNQDENKTAVVYYWDSRKALKKFSTHPIHQKAKQNYKKWYSGYEVIISEVLKFKSDNDL